MFDLNSTSFVDRVFPSYSVHLLKHLLTLLPYQYNSCHSSFFGLRSEGFGEMRLFNLVHCFAVFLLPQTWAALPSLEHDCHLLRSEVVDNIKTWVSKQDNGANCFGLILQPHKFGPGNWQKVTHISQVSVMLTNLSIGCMSILFSAGLPLVILNFTDQRDLSGILIHSEQIYPIRSQCAVGILAQESGEEAKIMAESLEVFAINSVFSTIVDEGKLDISLDTNPIGPWFQYRASTEARKFYKKVFMICAYQTSLHKSVV